MQRWLYRVVLVTSAFAVPFAVGASCSDSSDSNNSAGTAAGGSGTAAGGAGSGANSGTGGAGGQGYTGTGGAPTTIAECQGKIYECGDLIDNETVRFLAEVNARAIAKPLEISHVIQTVEETLARDDPAT